MHRLEAVWTVANCKGRDISGENSPSVTILISDVMTSRLLLLQSHLTGAPVQSPFKFENEGAGLREYRARGLAIDPDLTRRAIDGELWMYAKKCQETSCEAQILDNRLYHDKSRAELRELYVRQILAYWKTVGYSLAEEETDTRKLVFWLSPLWSVNLALSIRLSVHIILYCDTIRTLGTEKHWPYVERAFRLKDYGSFCLTELGHGSNAAGVETTATYDHSTREFELHSPTSTAAKWWIGAVGKTANMTVAFAKLVINGVNHGVHVFLVPIRSYDTHEALPGVILGDCGPKGGCHGIDNGFLLFNHYRVGYDALLDRFSHLSLDGKLKTSIKNKEKRFSAMLGGLVRGRFGISAGALLSLRNGLTIATRYAANRTQFGPPNRPETPILDYQVTRYRLAPHFANMFAAAIGMDLVRNLIEKHKNEMRENPDGPEGAELHALLSIFKPLCSWYSQQGLQACRELVAGHGYSAFSGLPTLLSDNDINATWEGENYVLLQQTARFLMKNVQKILKGQRVESEYCSFISLDAAGTGGTAKFTGKDELRGNPEVLRRIMEHRATLVMRRTMMKLQENSGKFGGVMETWNNTQIFYLQTLSYSFGEMVLTNEFSKAVSLITPQHAATGAVLSRLFELFVLTKVQSDLGTFREGDYLTSDQGITVKEYVLDLVNELGESLVRLVDAIAVPDRLIGSPFACSSGEMYKKYTNLVESAEDCYEKPKWGNLLSEVRKAL